MSTGYQIILMAILVLVIAQLAVVYLLARFIGQFINEIRSIGGVKFGGLEIGDEAPLFREWDQHKSKVVLKDLFTDKNTVLLFINMHCPTCKTLLPELQAIQSTYDVNLIVINANNAAEDDPIVKAIPDGVVYIRSPHVSDSYYIQKVPSAFILNEEGVITQQSHLQDAKGLWNLLVHQERIAS